MELIYLVAFLCVITTANAIIITSKDLQNMCNSVGTLLDQSFVRCNGHKMLRAQKNSLLLSSLSDDSYEEYHNDELTRQTVDTIVDMLSGTLIQSMRTSQKDNHDGVMTLLTSRAAKDSIVGQICSKIDIPTINTNSVLDIIRTITSLTDRLLQIVERCNLDAPLSNINQLTSGWNWMNNN